MAPIFVVATKSDLEHVVSTEDAEEMIDEIKDEEDLDGDDLAFWQVSSKTG